MRWILIPPLTVVLAGCVEQSKYDALQGQADDTAKQLAATKEELEKARQKIGEYQAHRYERFQNGLRTWRLDTVTGSSCILLTTEADWKNPQTSKSSCSCEDTYRDNPDATLALLQALKCVEP